MLRNIRIWYCRRTAPKDLRYQHSLIHQMIDAFTDQVIIRIKVNDTAVALSTFDQMLDEVRAIIFKHSNKLRDRAFISQEVGTHSKTA